MKKTNPSERDQMVRQIENQVATLQNAGLDIDWNKGTDPNWLFENLTVNGEEIFTKWNVNLKELNHYLAGMIMAFRCVNVIRSC